MKAKYSKGYLVGQYISSLVILEKKGRESPLKKNYQQFLSPSVFPSRKVHLGNNKDYVTNSVYDVDSL